MNDFLVICALIGTTLLIVRGTIFSPLQKLWPALFRCSQCTGTWVGVFAGAFGIVSLGHGRALNAALVGAATSFIAMLADAILLRLLGDPDS